MADANDGAELGWRLSTAVVLFHEAVARRLGLSAADHKALGVISRQAPLSAGELARLVGMRATTTTGLVDRLERAGYVRRVSDPADRRRVLIEPDPAHRPDLTDVFAELGRAMGAVTARYDAQQLATIADYVTRTTAVLEAQTRRLAGPDAPDAPDGAAGSAEG